MTGSVGEGSTMTATTQALLAMGFDHALFTGGTEIGGKAPRHQSHEMPHLGHVRGGGVRWVRRG
jgi:hypothetical protein